MDEAIPLFVQIAEGLEAAHEKGIIHRDLKPANIKVAPDGKVKILDFGLAKAFSEPEDVSAETSESPTVTKGTALGAIMGTAAYMSPEQARGKPVDKRTDIWAYGCCLYEALTAKKAFDGETVTDVIAAVVEREPDYGLLDGVRWRRLVQRCLVKDAKGRLHSVADARILMTETTDSSEPSQDGPIGARLGTYGALLLAIGAIVGAAIALGVASSGGGAPSRTRRLAIDLPDQAALARPGTGRSGQSVALSKDGSRLAYVGESEGKREIFVRAFDSDDVRAVPGTENATSPFFSPSGDRLGFFTGNGLSRVFLDRGEPEFLYEAGTYGGAVWLDDDTIVIGDNSGRRGVASVDPSGGDVRHLALPDRENGEAILSFPSPLDEGRMLVVSVAGEVQLDVLEIETGETFGAAEGCHAAASAANGPSRIHPRQNAVCSRVRSPHAQDEGRPRAGGSGVGS